MLLHGTRLSCKKPAKCVNELHSIEQQHANTHRLFIKLCWLMDKRAVSADRVVNIDESSFRRGVKKNSATGQHEEGHDTHGRLQHGPCPARDVGVETDAVLPEQPWPDHTHHVTSENGWATKTTILQLTAALDDVLNPSKEGQALILLWDMASFPCFIPSHSMSCLQPCATWQSSAASRAASRRKRAPHSTARSTTWS